MASQPLEFPLDVAGPVLDVCDFPFLIAQIAPFSKIPAPELVMQESASWAEIREAQLLTSLRVPNTGSMVELSSKFGALPGEAVDLIAFAHNNKLEVEGLSFHVGSQCTNVQNYSQALHLAAGIFSEVYSAHRIRPRGRFRSSTLSR